MITATLYAWAALIIWFLIGTTAVEGTLHGVRVRVWIACAILWPVLPIILLVHGLVMRWRR